MSLTGLLLALEADSGFADMRRMAAMSSDAIVEAPSALHPLVIADLVTSLKPGARSTTFVVTATGREAEDLDGGPGYPILTGDYSAVRSWQRHPVVVGTPVAKPTPVFTKLDPSVVEEELARLQS